MIGTLTKEMFSQYLDEKFHVHVESDNVVELELIEVTALTPHSSEGGSESTSAAALRQEPFSILFRGPNEFPLAQRMYRIEHDGMETIDNLFMAPVGADEHGRYYEAVFN